MAAQFRHGPIKDLGCPSGPDFLRARARCYLWLADPRRRRSGGHRSAPTTYAASAARRWPSPSSAAASPITEAPRRVLEWAARRARRAEATSAWLTIPDFAGLRRPIGEHEREAALILEGHHLLGPYLAQRAARRPISPASRRSTSTTPRRAGALGTSAASSSPTSSRRSRPSATAPYP